MSYSFGRKRWVEVDRLQAGHQLCENIRGLAGKILVAEGEILSQKHVDQIIRWCQRPGMGNLKLYTRGVWARVSLASGDEMPRCESDPYAAVSVQKWYRSHR